MQFGYVGNADVRDHSLCKKQHQEFFAAKYVTCTRDLLCSHGSAGWRHATNHWSCILTQLSRMEEILHTNWNNCRVQPGSPPQHRCTPDVLNSYLNGNKASWGNYFFITAACTQTINWSEGDICGTTFSKYPQNSTNSTNSRKNNSNAITEKIFTQDMLRKCDSARCADHSVICCVLHKE